MIPLALAIAMLLPVNYGIERDLMLNNRARSRMKLVSSALSKQFLNAANHASLRYVFTGSVCIRFKHFDLIHAHRSAAGSMRWGIGGLQFKLCQIHAGQGAGILYVIDVHTLLY
jgi:hypothetical protein